MEMGQKHGHTHFSAENLIGSETSAQQLCVEFVARRKITLTISLSSLFVVLFFVFFFFFFFVFALVVLPALGDDSLGFFGGVPELVVLASEVGVLVREHLDRLRHAPELLHQLLVQAGSGGQAIQRTWKR